MFMVPGDFPGAILLLFGLICMRMVKTDYTFVMTVMKRELILYAMWNIPVGCHTFNLELSPTTVIHGKNFTVKMQ